MQQIFTGRVESGRKPSRKPRNIKTKTKSAVVEEMVPVNSQNTVSGPVTPTAEFCRTRLRLEEPFPETEGTEHFDFQLICGDKNGYVLWTIVFLKMLCSSIFYMTHTHTFSISLAESLLESSCRHAAWTEHPGQFATSKCSYKSLGYGTCRTAFSTYFYHAVPVKISRKTNISAGIGARSSGRVLPVQERHVKVLSHIHSGPWWCFFTKH